MNVDARPLRMLVAIFVVELFAAVAVGSCAHVLHSPCLVEVTEAQ